MATWLIGMTVLTSQAAQAAATTVNGVRISPTEAGVQITLVTQGQRLASPLLQQQGDRWQADFPNAQLQLGANSDFRQDNPIPGIATIQVLPMGANSIRVVVVGQSGQPTVTTQPNGQDLLLMVQVGARSPQTVTSGSPVTAPTPPATQPLVPNPKITIQGGGGTVQPGLFQPRAIAPPVGDMAISTLDSSPTTVSLGTTERLPRLIVREAPIREVLTLLTLAAGLNFAYIEGPSNPGATSTAPTTITLNLQNESIQDVFDHVVRLANLEVNRVGQTIYASPKLPNTARNLIVRNLRLNQVTVGVAINFLVGMGAESALSRERVITSVTTVPVGEGQGNQTQSTQTQTTTESRVEVQRITTQDGVPLLRGLQVVGDERTNAVTLIGDVNKVEMAMAQLVRLDLRRRQVSVNVRVIDVNLSNSDRVGTSFSFGVDETQFLNTAGIGVINFGVTGMPGFTPAATTLQSTQVGSGVLNATGINLPANVLNFIQNFLVQLQANVVSGNAKILTDPVLVVQEGQRANVELTQEVITNIKVRTTLVQGVGSQTETTFEKDKAGLNLLIQVDRIDDNGFVNLSVAPSIKTPTDTFRTANGDSAVLLSERKLSTGQVRLRDGQTLILSGIIRDQDRSSVSKLPLLGDIPILGALFRRTERTNERTEVVVLLTPKILNDSDQSTAGFTPNLSPATLRMLGRPNPRK